MIPGRYDIEVYDGDSYRGPLIVLPSLAPFGGPSDLTAATVAAQVRPSADATDSDALTVDIQNPATRELRLTLTAAEVLGLPSSGVWDLQVTQDPFVGTVLAGKFKKLKQVTR